MLVYNEFYRRYSKRRRGTFVYILSRRTKINI